MANDYKDMLISRARKASEAAPSVPEKPMTMLQYQNHLNTRAWRERLHNYRMNAPS